MAKTKTAFEVTIETGCEPLSDGPRATTRITVTVGGISKSNMTTPDTSQLGWLIEQLYKAACVEFTATRLGAN